MISGVLLRFISAMHYRSAVLSNDLICIFNFLTSYLITYAVVRNFSKIGRMQGFFLRRTTQALNLNLYSYLQTRT